MADWLDDASDIWVVKDWHSFSLRQILIAHGLAGFLIGNIIKNIS